MVILSDGAETTGDALNAAKFASAADVQIVVMPFLSQVDAEALVTEVDAPTHLRGGEQFDLNVSIQANQSMRATVRVLAKNQILYEATHELHKGNQTLSLPLTANDWAFLHLGIHTLLPEVHDPGKDYDIWVDEIQFTGCQ